MIDADIASIVADAKIYIDYAAPASARVRAAIYGTGGSASYGWGATEDEARAGLARVIAFNIEHNGAPIA